MYKIPVILLNYNSATDCQKCIASLKQQCGVDIKIIVVDNCSEESDLNNLRNICRETESTLIENTLNKGYNAGNNIGLMYAVNEGYEYALIANPDMEFPETDYIAAVVEVMRKDEDIVVCGTDIISPSGIHQNPCKRDGNGYDSFNWVFYSIRDCFKKTDRDPLTGDKYDTSHYCQKLSGCCLFVKLDYIKSIGYFDENVFLYCEEAILSRVVEKTGKKMYYYAHKHAVHNHIPSVKGNPKRRIENWIDSRNYYIDNYSGNSWLGCKLEKFSNFIYLIVFKVFK